MIAISVDKDYICIEDGDRSSASVIEMRTVTRGDTTPGIEFYVRWRVRAAAGWRPPGMEFAALLDYVNWLEESLETP